MRKVKIINIGLDIAGKSTKVTCPLKDKPNEYGYCETTCAWFRIKKKYATGSDKDKLLYQHAYCGDKLIGEIVEDNNG